MEEADRSRVQKAMHALHGVETGLVLLVPEADHVVGPWRARLDQVAAEGLSAHVTVLVPFAPPDRIDAAMLHRIQEIAAASAPLAFELTSVGWFGTHAVWLGVEPAAPLIALIERFQSQFSEYPRYGGSHDEIIPHLSIGTGSDVAEMRLAAVAVEKQLPIRCQVGALSLVVRDSVSQRWKVGASFALERRA